MSELFSGLSLNQIESHKIPERPTVKNLSIYLPDYKYRSEQEEKNTVEVQETTIPIDHQGNRIFVKTISYDLPKQQENKEDEPSRTIIFFASDISRSLSRIGIAVGRIQEACETKNISKIVIVPQLATSVRISDKYSDPVKQPTFEQQAEIIAKALNTSEIYNTNYVKNNDFIPDNSIFIGYSAGAPLALETAVKLNKKVKDLILIDPVGIVNFPSRRSFFYNIGPKDRYSLIKEYHQQGNSWINAWKLSREGKNSPFKKIQNYRDYRQEKKEISTAYNVDNKQRPTVINSAPVITDSTQEARSKLDPKTNIIIGMEKSSPLNLQILFMIQNQYKKFNEFKDHITQNIKNSDNIFRQILKPLFPSIKEESFTVVTQEGYSHTIPAIDTEFWKNIFEKIKTPPKPTSSQESNQP